MKPWGIAATLGFAVLAFVLGQASGGVVVVALGNVKFLHIAEDGTALAIIVLVGNPVQVVTLALAARLTGSDAMTYLALDRPRLRHIGISAAVLAGLIAGSDLGTYALGKDIVTPFQFSITRSAQANGSLVWLWLAVVVGAPVGEEILFREFIFRGLVREPRNALPGILVISLVWASLHFGQYDIFAVGVVFLFGLMLGYVRYLYGSTTLTILLHMLYNLEGMVETYVALGWI